MNCHQPDRFAAPHSPAYRSSIISIKDFALDRSQRAFMHGGLSRPESIIAEPDGATGVHDN